MSKYTCLLSMLLLLGGSECGSTTRHDGSDTGTPEVGVKSCRDDADEGFEVFESGETKESETVETEDCVFGTVEDDEKKEKQEKVKKIKKIKKYIYIYDDNDDLPIYERIRNRVLHEMERSRVRLYNKFFDYLQYILDKAEYGGGLEILDHVILSAIVFAILKCMQHVIRCLTVLFYKFKRSQNLLREIFNKSIALAIEHADGMD